MPLITVFACESQPMVIEGLRVALEACPKLMLIGAAPPEEAAPLVARLHPAVVLVSPLEESEQALELLQSLHRASPSSGLVLWVRNPECIPRRLAFDAGAKGILRRTAPCAVLMDCLVTVGEGGVWAESQCGPGGPASKSVRLTPRERQILRLLCRGMKNDQIARALAIAPGTVKVHLMHMFEKTGARNRYELAIRTWRLGLDPGGESHAE
ncbi:MAG: response regulator transcription factor [Bryobacterales bacterium]|nr:response regulator transcription factor [Bryobacteraceae bacterium]MDW8129544.1 response regulator transcription factor [Bryobacterales bacterium]